jgi:hypothetical protein
MFAAILLLIAICCVIVSVYQAVIRYNPVPVWDMLDGYLGFLENIREGRWYAWFAPHNEHRIFLQRILFWLDNYAFKGTNGFLIAANLVCIGINTMMIALFGYSLIKRKEFYYGCLVPVLIAWCYLLCQGENIIWAFQAQFHLAYLVPLIGLYILTAAYERPSLTRLLVVSFFGFLSIGTMGNGVLATPMFVVLALFLRLPLYAVATLGVATAVQVVALVLGGSGTTPALVSTFLSNPIGFFRYVTRLLGSPFYYLLGEDDTYFQIEIIGSVFIALLAYQFIRLVLQPGASRRKFGLLFFCGYVALSYVGAAGGRLVFGLDGSVQTHYTTPALLGWAALLTLYAPWLESWRNQVPLRAVAVLFALFLLWYQYGAISYATDPIFGYRVATLGVALGADDQAAQRTLTAPDFFRQVGEFGEPAYLHNLGVYRSYPFSGLRESLNKPPPRGVLGAQASCRLGQIDVASVTDPNFLRFSTTIDVPKDLTKYPDFVRLVDRGGRQVGFGFVKSWWTDRLEALSSDDDAYRLEMRGYVLSSEKNSLKAYVEKHKKPFCSADVTLPDTAIESIAASLSLPVDTIAEGQIENRGEIHGTDAFHTNMCRYGLKVYGSFGAGEDGDVASIKIKIHKGDKILYRSGPTGGNQVMSVGGGRTIGLPVAGDWIFLRVNDTLFGDRSEMEVSLEDRGTGWGEWSAIAVKPDGPCGGH